MQIPYPTPPDIGSISRNALENFIYLIGTARGGTTILRDAIGIHDNILMLPGMTHFMNQVWRYRNKVHPRLLTQIFRLPGFYNERDVLENLDEDKRRNLQKYITRVLGSRDLRLMWQVYPLVYTLDVNSHKKPEEILCWGDKANDFYRVSDVARYFPKARFIFIIRDPRASVSSIARRMLLKEEFHSKIEISCEKLVLACINWRNMTQRMLHFSKIRPGKTLMIRFEDFLMNPEDIMNRIFSFTVGKRLSTADISDRLKGLGYGASNEIDESGTGISQKPMDRWKKILDEKQVELVNSLTRKTALKLGYSMPPTSISPFSALSYVSSWKSRAINGAKLSFLEIFEQLL